MKYSTTIVATAMLLVVGGAAAQDTRHPTRDRERPPAGELSQLGQLAHIGQLSQLSQLSHLDQLSHLGQLSRLSELSHLSGLGHLGDLSHMALTEHSGISFEERSLERRIPPAAWAPGDDADSLYREGRRAISDEDYRRAARIFLQLVDRYPDSEYAGDALYWRAWSLYRHALATRPTREAFDDALIALDKQQRDYAKTRYVDEGRDLRTRIRAEQAKLGDSQADQELRTQATRLSERGACPSSDDDERLIALQGLMQMDAESAIPILRDVLRRRDRCSQSMREQAVFLVSQKRGDESTRILLDVAKNDPSDEVRSQAIHWLGQTRSELALPALDSILFTTTDQKTREAAIFALSQQRDPRAAAALRRVAEDERMPVELRANAIHWIGQMRSSENTSAFLRELYRKTRETQIREQILHAFATTNDPEAGKWLMEIATDRSQPIEMRKNAIFWVAQQRGTDLPALFKLYEQMRGEREIQEQLLHAFSQRRESEATDKLIEIASKESDRELRKNAIFWLSQRKDPRALQFIKELINK